MIETTKNTTAATADVTLFFWGFSFMTGLASNNSWAA